MVAVLTAVFGGRGRVMSFVYSATFMETNVTYCNRNSEV